MSGGSGERLLAILDLFDETHFAWSPQRMMDRLGYSRPTLYRYLKLLREAGLLSPAAGGAFTLGPRVVELDYLVRQSDPLVACSQPHLAALAGRFPGTAFLAQWYGDKLLCVAAESRDAAARTSYPRGRPMPLTRGAVARAIVSHLPRREQARLIAAHGPDYAAIGLGATESEVLAAFRAIRRAGIATAHGEVTPGIVGTAAPVLDAARHPLAALCLSMEAADRARLDPAEVAGAIQHAAAAIGCNMAGPTETTPGEQPEHAGELA